MSRLSVDQVWASHLSIGASVLHLSPPSHPLSLSQSSLNLSYGPFPLQSLLPPPPSSLVSAGCFHGNITFNCLQWALTFQFRWGGGWKWVESFLFFLLLSVGRLPFLCWFVWCDSCCVCFHLSAAGNPPETCEQTCMLSSWFSSGVVRFYTFFSWSL